MERQGTGKRVFRGELALAIVVFLNSLTVVLLLYSGFGISPMSSVYYTLHRLFPGLTLGTWSYLYQTGLVAVLMLARRRFVFSYLFSFVVGVAFGVAVDIHELWISQLPAGLGARIVYLPVGMIGLALGISLANHCKLPIAPTDLFPREMSAAFGWPYKRVKTTCDIVCLSVTVILSVLILDGVDGVGLGTVLCALFMGRLVAIFNGILDRNFYFVTALERKRIKNPSTV